MPLDLPFDMVGLSGLWGEQNTREAKMFFWWVRMIFLCGGFANKRESHVYDSVYYLLYVEKKTTENTLNIRFFGENVLGET